MVTHFSANHYSFNASTSDLCLDPPSCHEWVQTITRHMEGVLARAEEDFTNFLNYDPHRIICLDDHVVEDVDRLGLSWRAFARSIHEAYILEWYDREDLVPLLEEQLKKRRRNSDSMRYQMTLRTGHQVRSFRSKSVQDFDARSEYRATPGRYRMVLRCDAPQSAPLVVEATYDTPKQEGETWALHVGVVDRPAAAKWNEDYTQLICRCGERTTSYNTSPPILLAPRYA